MAFTYQDGPRRQAQVVVCDEIFKYRSPYRLDDLPCSQIGNFAFQNWVTIGHSYTREFTHVSNLMYSAVGVRMDDYQGSAAQPPLNGYGSHNFMMLNRLWKAAFLNANNYAW